MPVWPLAAGDQQHQAARQVVEKKLQAAIEHRPLGQVIVVQYQQQGCIGLQVQRQLVEQAVDPFLEREGLVALAHFQQAHGLAAQRRAVLLQTLKQAFEKTARVSIALAEPKPEAAPMVGQRLAEFDGQGALAEACRGIDQQQTAAEASLQTLAQARTRHVAVRQRRPEETPVQQAHGLAGDSMRTGQISHGRLVLVGRLRRYGLFRD